MKKLKTSSQFKKDYKRFRNNSQKVKKLFEVLNLLKNDSAIPETYRSHSELFG